MGRSDRPDTQADGQINIESWLSLPERLYAVSRIFAKARKEMTLPEQKTFVYALSKFHFMEEPETDVVYLDKKRLAEIIGINTDIDHLSVDLHQRIKELPKHSYIEITKEDKDVFDSGVLISRVTMLKNRVRVKFEKEYLPLFTNLGKEKNYLTMWSSDIFQMASIRTVRFYEHLREITDNRLDTNDVLLGIRALKELFDIPKDGEGAYMRKDGHFDRVAFEKRIIDPLCEDMKHCKMIQLLIQPDGKYYVKEKSGGRVSGYRFYWTFSARPGIATAEEMQEIREAIDKDPAVLKVAKDIVNGKKKPKQKKATFTDFEQRSYDYDELEARLLRMRKGDQ